MQRIKEFFGRNGFLFMPPTDVTSEEIKKIISVVKQNPESALSQTGKPMLLKTNGEKDIPEVEVTIKTLSGRVMNIQESLEYLENKTTLTKIQDIFVPIDRNVGFLIKWNRNEKLPRVEISNYKKTERIRIPFYKKI